MHDPVKYALWIGGIAMALMVVTAFYVVSANVGSRNLALGLGALLGACLIFGIQLYFELKGSESVTDFPMEYSVDYKERAVRSMSAFRPSTSFSQMRSTFVEIDASKILAARTLGQDDAPKIARDLAIVSFLIFLAEEQPDWQLKVVSYRTTLGSSLQWQSLSTESERTRITFEKIRERLKAAGNIFSDIGRAGFRDVFDLPPGSKIEITSTSVRLLCPVVTVEFAVQEPFHSMHSWDPHQLLAFVAKKEPIQATLPMLDDGKTPRYQNVTIGVRTTVAYAGLRAQAGDLTKYQDWAKRLIDGAQARLVPTP